MSMPSTNPIHRIAFRVEDFRSVPVGGGPPKRHVPVTPELRRWISSRVREAAQRFQMMQSAFPDAPPPAVLLRLRDSAIAKSHRPLQLLTASELPVIGNGDLGDVLVSGSAVGLELLAENVLRITSRAGIAQISTIEDIRPWEARDALTYTLRSEDWRAHYLALIRSGKCSVLLELFEQPDATLRAISLSSLKAYIRNELRVPLAETPRATHDLTTLVVRGELSGEQIDAIAAHPSIFRVRLAGAARPVIPQVASDSPSSRLAWPAPSKDLPIVGVLDSGVHTPSTFLDPWVIGRRQAIIPADQDRTHGTFVASMVIGALSLNPPHTHAINSPSARVFDVCALERGPTDVADIVDALRSALQEQQDIRVWNLSLGDSSPVTDDAFSWFGQELDRLSDEYNVLFVVAAGNSPALRGWPPVADVPNHRICAPADSVRALTVGSLAHLDDDISMVRAGEPAPYSRRGPGPARTPKPDIVMVGGNCDLHSNSLDTGINGLAPGDTAYRNAGTSFAAPQAAALAAHLWAALEAQRGSEDPVTPVLVKALMIHNAMLRAPEREGWERRFYGHGQPGPVADCLLAADDSFTLVFEPKLVDRLKWTTHPYPVPDCLLVDGKFRGEILLTLCYAPPLSEQFGAEYVRANVDVSFGGYVLNDDGNPEIRGLVPFVVDGAAESNREAAQVEHGYKWSPVKTYRKRFPRGQAVPEVLALQASLTRRASERPHDQPLPVVIICTLRALSPELPVYQQGLQKLRNTAWVATDLVDTGRVTVS
jgi:hypothetical protein